MKKSNLSVVCAIVALCGMAGFARAQVTATLTGLNPFEFDTIFANGQDLGGGGVGEEIWSGSAANASPFNGNFITFCIDLQENLGLGGTYSFAIDPVLTTAPKVTAGLPGEFPMNQTQANQLEALFYADYGSLVTTNFISGNQPGGIAVGSAAGNAIQAFQLAIWAIVYDNTTDPTTNVTSNTNNFYESGVNATAAGLADTELDAAIIAASSGGPFEQNLEALTGLPDIGQPYNTGFAQDQIVVNPNLPTSGSLVPTPTAALGGAMLMICLGLASFYTRRVRESSF